MSDSPKQHGSVQQVEATPFAQEDVTRQIERIAASKTFGGAEALRRLLLFLARTLSSGEPAPKEYEIAVSVLDRGEHFDARVDSAARVLVGRLRAKLAEYYWDEGRNDSILVDLPRGGYALRCRPGQEREREGEPSEDDDTPEPSRSRKRLLGYIAVTLAIGIASWLGGFWRGSRSAPPRPRPFETPEFQAFWQPFVQSPRPLVMVIGAPRFSIVGPLLFRIPTLNTQSEVDASEDVKKIERLFGIPAASAANFTSIGDTFAALAITRLLARHKQDIRFRRSDAFQWDEFRTANLIFLGAPKFNLPTRDLPIEAEYVCGIASITVLHPRPGEQSEFQERFLPDNLTETHVLVTRLSNVTGDGHVLVLASPTVEGTLAAALTLCEPGQAHVLLGRLASPGGVPASFQAVLSMRLRSKEPVQITYASHRVLRRGM